MPSNSRQSEETSGWRFWAKQRKNRDHESLDYPFGGIKQCKSMVIWKDFPSFFVATSNPMRQIVCWRSDAEIILQKSWLIRKWRQKNKKGSHVIWHGDLFGMQGVSIWMFSKDGMTSIHLCQGWWWSWMCRRTPSVWYLIFIEYDNIDAQSGFYASNVWRTRPRAVERINRQNVFFWCQAVRWWELRSSALPEMYRHKSKILRVFVCVLILKCYVFSCFSSWLP